jgi:hypothetical protein
MEYNCSNYDWASKSLRDIEALNHSACNWIEEQGYNSRAFRIRANVRPTSLHENQIQRDAPQEESINAITLNGISLSSLFHNYLSVDEIFLAFEYCGRLRLHDIEKNAHLKITKQMEI